MCREVDVSWPCVVKSVRVMRCVGQEAGLLRCVDTTLVVALFTPPPFQPHPITLQHLLLSWLLPHDSSLNVQTLICQGRNGREKMVALMVSILTKRNFSPLRPS